jgi:hypothetical protein
MKFEMHCYSLDVQCSPKFLMLLVWSPAWYDREMLESVRGGD